MCRGCSIFFFFFFFLIGKRSSMYKARPNGRVDFSRAQIWQRAQVVEIRIRTKLLFAWYSHCLSLHICTLGPPLMPCHVHKIATAYEIFRCIYFFYRCCNFIQWGIIRRLAYNNFVHTSKEPCSCRTQSANVRLFAIPETVCELAKSQLCHWVEL